MAKSNKHAAKTAAAPEVTPADDIVETLVTETPTPEVTPADDIVPLAKMRGPRGVPETAVITVNVANPKRPNSKAHAAFALYASGMTVGGFCDAVDALTVAGKSQKGMGTPHLVYDSKHGFISIENYTVPGGVETPKPKAPPKPKAEKSPKAEKAYKGPKVVTPASAELAETAGDMEAAVEEETVD